MKTLYKISIGLCLILALTFVTSGIAVAGTSPKANMSYSIDYNNSTNIGIGIKFIDTSLGSPTSWSWNFGDGNNSTVQNPKHFYVPGKVYWVNLTVSNQLGESLLVTRVPVYDIECS